MDTSTHGCSRPPLSLQGLGDPQEGSGTKPYKGERGGKGEEAAEPPEEPFWFFLNFFVPVISVSPPAQPWDAALCSYLMKERAGLGVR